MKLDFLQEFDFFTGVPDSQLRPLCDWLMETYGISGHHVIAANEGGAAALAAGYHLATGKVPVVYLQNSGLGNIINPAASLLHSQVYGIPCLFIVGWRGEPGVPDEPQHRFQGEVTLKLLEDMEIPAFVIRKETQRGELDRVMEEYRRLFAEGRQAALVICKGALEYGGKVKYANGCTLTREEAIRIVTVFSGDDPVVCTTGKASRELFELRERAGVDHSRDFLTVGSMGHSSSIALGIALQRPERRVWIIDGDGAALMHLGAMGVLGSCRPGNLIHVLINNGAHESVGGMPTPVGPDLTAAAKACGYPNAVRVEDAAGLEAALRAAVERHELTFIEVRCAIGSRADLGRPTTTPAENKEAFMAALRK